MLVQYGGRSDGYAFVARDHHTPWETVGEPMRLRTPHGSRPESRWVGAAVQAGVLAGTVKDIL
ncbi:MAG: hypothetical protein IV100_05845, partial [Myxococcales bacterium]|nr:hypothetical protein [Myxococcales bacterium]